MYSKKQIKEAPTRVLYEWKRYLCQLKHKSSNNRRLTKIERALGEIKHEIHLRKEKKLYDAKKL